ncbi:dihydrofolate reductase [Paenibacillus sp. GSMTC-2017]|nr:dihydrofolate reductase [Paenibacillus sp. GSMTC-2017]
MAKVIVDITMSLDGFIAAPNGDPAPQLHQWFFAPSDSSIQVIQEQLDTTGAIIMGRRTYDAGDKADGFIDNPFDVPHFVLTHTTPEKAAKGASSFTFVTDGIQSALKQALDAAHDKDVCIMGGATIIQQYIKAGLIDEIQVQIVPILLGEGTRLFDQIGNKSIELESTRVIESSNVTHLRFNVINK